MNARRGRIRALGALWFLVVIASDHVVGSAPTGIVEAQPDTAAISGIVTDAVTQLPVEGAVVALTRVDAVALQSQPRMATDAKGRFVFFGLGGGAYSVRVEAQGYLGGGFRLVPGDTSEELIRVGNGEWRANVVVVLWRPAAIAGTVSDERGDPIVDAPVRVFARMPVAGNARWVAGSVSRTDDRGVFRIPGLVPGRYAVQVVSVAASREHHSAPRYPSMFYPSGRSISEAMPVDVTFGQSLTGISVGMVRTEVFSVSGWVSAPDGPVTDTVVRALLVGNESLGLGGEAGFARTDASGRFSLDGIPPGRYRLVADQSVSEYLMTYRGVRQAVVPDDMNLFVSRVTNTPVGGLDGVLFNTATRKGSAAGGETTVDVSRGDVDGVVIQALAPTTVSGWFAWDGEGTNVDSDGDVGIRLEPVDGDVLKGVHLSDRKGPADIGASGRVEFTVHGVKPGRYTVSFVGRGSRYRLVAVLHRGRNVLETALEVRPGEPALGDLEVHLTSQRNSLSGTVRATDGHLVPTGAVVLIPKARHVWNEPGVSGVLFRRTTIDSLGRYTLADVIPGEYFLVAVTTAAAAMLTSGDLDGMAAQAVSITVGVSSGLVRDLRLVEDLR